MQITRASFKDVMATAPGPVAIVTAFDPCGCPAGLTVSAVCAVSISPPMVLVCLDRGSATLQAVRVSGAFTVNYLRHGRDALALRFATKDPEKFSGASWSWPEGGQGGPVLQDDAAGWVTCAVSKVIEAGDHDVVLGEVVDGQVLTEHALAYAGREFFSRAELE